jgi:hypothetical protein
MVKRCSEASELLAAVGAVVVVALIYFYAIFSNIVEIRLLFSRSDRRALSLFGATALANLYLFRKQDPV